MGTEVKKMKVSILSVGPIGTNCYLLYGEDGDCAVIDPGAEPEKVVARMRELSLTPRMILLTHGHYDHIGGIPGLKALYPSLPVYVHEKDKEMMEDPEKNFSTAFDPAGFAVSPDFTLKAGDTLPLSGGTIRLIHTPGHTVDHICTRTPDNVLYLGDAMMTGRTLHHSKFPYAFCVKDYLDSMRKMRTEPADKFIVAHFGIYDEILPLVDMEARFFAERMVDLLDLIEGPTTPAKMAADICRRYKIDAGDLRNLSYFASSSLSYINYLRGLGYLEAYIEDNQIFYRRTPASYERKEQKREAVLPKTGQFR